MGKLKMVSEGERVPNAPLAGVDGQTFTLERYAGRPLVLYFYPKADTPGCTNEAKDFSALTNEFDTLGVSVIGRSDRSRVGKAWVSTCIFRCWPYSLKKKK